ncbi:MAG: hypothetical protein AAFZ15_31530 [Bacteroidota bacterium]
MKYKGFFRPLLAIAFALSLTCLFSQDRNVMYVHGLGENATTWDIYDALFDAERQHDGRSPNFVDGAGVAAMATSVSGGVITGFPGSSGPSTLNIGIGHSMGGLGIREVDRTRTGNTQRFGALVTVGSPNNGAQIINSVRDGSVTDAMEDACEKLSAGPLSEIPGMLGVFVSGVGNDVICSILADELLDGLITNAVAGPSEDDMVVGSPFLGTLNGAAPNVPAISIWGNENSPVHWRLLSSFDTDNANDTKYVEIANLMRNIYNGFYILHLSKAIVGGFLGFINPAIWAAAAVHAWQASQWHKGKKWFDNSESIWNGLTGCVATEMDITITYTTSAYWSFCSCFSTGSQDWIDCVDFHCPNGISNCLEEVSYTQTIIVNDKSDGLLCDQTQLIGGLASGDVYEAKGVNHNEETNTTNGTTDDGSDVIGDTFRAIWDRNDIFGIPPR